MDGCEYNSTWAWINTNYDATNFNYYKQHWCAKKDPNVDN